jgi:N6-adenosine-specific RNA methylase IME4
MAAGAGRGEAWPFGDLPRHHFGAIAIDAPWRFASNSDARPGRNARGHYATMTVPEIACLPVEKLAAPDCWLFLWITAPFLALGAQTGICQAWGFRISTVGLTWIKRSEAGVLATGTGYTTRGNPEFVVIARKGRPARVSRGVHSVIEAPRREHSRKPDQFYASVDALVGNVAKVDLFARETRPGWVAWGNEIGRFAEAAE